MYVLAALTQQALHIADMYTYIYIYNTLKHTSIYAYHAWQTCRPIATQKDTVGVPATSTVTDWQIHSI